MTIYFLCFELLWGFEGPCYNSEAINHFYGFAVGYWFFGICIASLRKDNHGQQV